MQIHRRRRVGKTSPLQISQSGRGVVQAPNGLFPMETVRGVAGFPQEIRGLITVRMFTSFGRPSQGYRGLFAERRAAPSHLPAPCSGEERFFPRVAVFRRLDFAAV